MTEELTIITLLSGRFVTMDAYFWGLSIIGYPKDKINLLYLTNSKNDVFKNTFKNRLSKLEGYKSIRFSESTLKEPVSDAFMENGSHSTEYFKIIADLYNEVYPQIETDLFLSLEDDVIAPSNTMQLLKHFKDDVGYVCGECSTRHGSGLFVYDIGYKKVFPDTEQYQYYAIQDTKPWGVKEIGMSHLGLTLLRKSILDKLPKPIYKNRAKLPWSDSIKSCDWVLCLEITKSLNLKRICDFDVRALHMDSKGNIH